MNTGASQEAVRANEQYSLVQTLSIWLVAAVPLLLAWVLFPALAPRVGIDTGILLWVLMIAGLLWQVLLSLVFLYGEMGMLNLVAIRHRTWQQHPRDPKTGQPRRRLWLWLIPLILVALERNLFSSITYHWMDVLQGST